MKTLACQVCTVRYLVAATDSEHTVADSLCPVCRRHQLASGRELGLVLWFQPRKGHGYVRLASGARVRCHRANLQNVRRLNRGDLVQLRIHDCPRGLEGRDVVRLATRRQLARTEDTLDAVPVPE